MTQSACMSVRGLARMCFWKCGPARGLGAPRRPFGDVRIAGPHFRRCPSPLGQCATQSPVPFGLSTKQSITKVSTFNQDLTLKGACAARREAAPPRAGGARSRAPAAGKMPASPGCQMQRAFPLQRAVIGSSTIGATGQPDIRPAVRPGRRPALLCAWIRAVCVGAKRNLHNLCVLRAFVIFALKTNAPCLRVPAPFA